MKKFKLIKEIIDKSINDTWDKAKEEWKIERSYINNDYDVCLCGHYPIKEIIIIKNSYNENECTIGNCCINKIFSNKYNKFFTALLKNKINSLIIDTALKDKIINIKESSFLHDIWRKRKLTYKQDKWFTILKNKILKYYIK